jgi:hypothetical protein
MACQIVRGQLRVSNRAGFNRSSLSAPTAAMEVRQRMFSCAVGVVEISIWTDGCRPDIHFYL